MKNSTRSTRNEQTSFTKLTHNIAMEADQILPGMTNADGKKVGLPLIYLPLADLKLDPNNVRFRHVGLNLTDSKIEELIWQDFDTGKLYHDIQNTLGIIEPIYVDSNNVVLEGNRRLVCLRRIAREIRGDMIRKIPIRYIDPVPSRLIPSEVDLSIKDEFLARVHIGGKKQWRPLDQAAHLHELYNVHGKSLELLSDITSLTKHSIELSVKAYELTSEYHKTHPGDSEWVSKFSYFFELLRGPAIKDWLAKKSNVRLVMKWIANKQIERGEEVRKISSIINDEKKLDLMKKGKRLREVLLMTTSTNVGRNSHNIIASKAQTKHDKKKKHATQISLDHFFDIANETIMKSNKLVLDKKDFNRLNLLRKEIDKLLAKNKNINNRD